MKPECSVVVPLFNEQQVLPTLHARLSAVMRRMAIPYEVVYVDDGSKDSTPEMIADLCDQDTAVKAIFLSRNFGHQAALCAGLEAATGRCVISIDGDLQDPPEIIPQLVEKWHDGYDVVFARRRRRKEDFFKRAACFIFYRLLSWVSDVDIALDTGDFALMDRHAIDQLNSLPERTRFVRGLRGWVGFKQVEVAYDRDIRRDGVSKYPFSRLLRLALDGFVAFSDAPLRMISMTGLLMCLIGSLALVLSASAALLPQLLTLSALWSAIIGGGILLTGMQITAVGIVGEYVSRIYVETRNRPLYIVRQQLNFKRHPRPVPEVLEFLPTEPTTQQEAATTARMGGRL